MLEFLIIIVILFFVAAILMIRLLIIAVKTTKTEEDLLIDLLQSRINKLSGETLVFMIERANLLKKEWSMDQLLSLEEKMYDDIEDESNHQYDLGKYNTLQEITSEIASLKTESF